MLVTIAVCADRCVGKYIDVSCECTEKLTGMLNLTRKTAQYADVPVGCSAILPNVDTNFTYRRILTSDIALCSIYLRVRYGPYRRQTKSVRSCKLHKSKVSGLRSLEIRARR